ncbi:unnamed protein product [Oikopleura dioica]|uniref:Uncharacterized protein n=1 Tax=Oikopleura dioica TaxID=34765 RepID=E4XWX4_OIKDI|nr:unnamed protein product [Oikopleura dioica]
MEFTETYEILVKIPKDSGSLSERFLFYVTAGIFHDSLSFYLQYGRKSQQFLMHVRACSSRASPNLQLCLQCTHARSKGTMCKAVTKIIVLDPKMIKSEKRLEAKRERTIFKLDHEFPDIKDLSKYGTVTTHPSNT